MTKAKHTGSSRLGTQTIGNGRRSHGPVLSKRVVTESMRMRERQQATFNFERQRLGFTQQTQRAIEELRNEHNPDAHDSPAPLAIADADDDMDWEDLDISTSLAGDEAMAQSMWELVTHQWYGRRQHHDGRTRNQRRQRLTANWEPVLKLLPDAYLCWKYPPPRSPDPVPRKPAIPVQDPSEPEHLVQDDLYPSQPPAPNHGTYDFCVYVIDIYTLEREVTIRHNDEDCSAVALVRNGYLSATPQKFDLVVSLKTLELFRRLRLRKPPFSVKAFGRVICDFYNVSYSYRYRLAIAESFEIYLTILRVIDTRVLTALGRDTPDWRAQNACPACAYELDDEPEHRFRRMLVVDGNNSLKRITRIGQQSVADTRVFTQSDYFLTTGVY
ncbi:hypothetical protein HGRIS_000100 [Hohenbuehelia grisea]|uniref:Transposase n=1 Tax=Hohenbuehelia grisea TaxID=104357 RepID=A0ABR3JQ31_9AGAR